MNICFCGHFSGGGTERVTFQLANELINDCHINIFIVNVGSSESTFELSSKVVLKNLQHGNLFSTVLQIRHLLKFYKIDILISVEALMGIYCIPATIGTNVKNIVWEHANYYQKQGCRWTSLIRKIWLYYANYYIVLTKRDLKNFTQNENVHCPIDFIYNPVRILRDIQKEYDINSRIIVSAGHIRPIKQFILIPQIFSLIGNENKDWQWYIYGDGSEEEILKLKVEIAKYKLQDKIILKGRSKNMDEVYSSASLYVLTSRQEGLPTVLLEAQLHGLPCISFDIETGPDEIIDNGFNGYLVSPYDVQAMANSIGDLLKNHDKRKLFSKNTRSIYDKFDFDRSIIKWKSVIRQCGNMNEYDK